MEVCKNFDLITARSRVLNVDRFSPFAGSQIQMTNALVFHTVISYNNLIWKCLYVAKIKGLSKMLEKDVKCDVYFQLECSKICCHWTKWLLFFNKLLSDKKMYSTSSSSSLMNIETFIIKLGFDSQNVFITNVFVKADLNLTTNNFFFLMLIAVLTHAAILSNQKISLAALVWHASSA